MTQEHPEYYVRPRSKLTKKPQVSIPKVLADAVDIQSVDDPVWENTGGVLRVYTEHDPINRRGVLERLRLFDQATERQAQREGSDGLACLMRSPAPVSTSVNVCGMNSYWTWTRSSHCLAQ